MFSPDTLKTFQETYQLLYENQASEILHDFYREIEHRNDNTNHLKLNCESVVHATEVIAENEISTDYQIFLDKRDDRVNSEIEKRYRLKDAIINKMKNLRKQLSEFLDSLKNISLDAHKDERVDYLMKRQRNFVAESEKLNDIESRSSQNYAELQRDWAQEEIEAKRKLNDLKLEHSYFMQKHKNTENEIKLDREQTHEKLKIITSESFKVLRVSIFFLFA